MTTITQRNVDRLQHVAVSRLTVFTMARIHELVGEVQTWLVDQVRRAGDDEAGGVDMAVLAGLLPLFEGRWKQAMSRYTALLTQARIQAGDIAFRNLATHHNAYITSPVERVEEAFTPTPIDWQRLTEMWIRRRNLALQTAQQRVLGDGMTLSQRIWRLDNGGYNQVRATMATAMANGTSAVRLAQDLEQQLGVDAALPRWAYSRLSKMTPAERAQDMTGLLSDPEYRTQGVAYNALRLARNEIQAANHAVTTEIAAHSPWVTGRFVRLSPAHPRSDQCDTEAAGGPYDKSYNALPLHPQCVTPGQLVQTDRGAIPIESVMVGDYVLTHKGRYCLVTAAWGTDHNDQVYGFETDAGKFELTGNHPVLLTRGWVNAQDVQLGDHVLYTAGGVLPDLASVVAEDMPTLRGKPSIASGVFGSGSCVPTNAVHFNGDSAGDESEVEEVAPDLVLSFVSEAGGVQGINHGEFRAGGVVESPLSLGQVHGYQAGVVGFLGSGDFVAHVGALGDIDAEAEQMAVGGAHLDGSRGAPVSIVFEPLVGDGLTVSAQRDTVGEQQLFETTIGDSVPFENLRGSEALNYVDLSQEVCDGPTIFSFDAQGLKLCGADVVLSEMGSRPSLHLQAANGASDGHDNLLLLSPERPWGAGSGNPVVRGVITPSQALPNYTTVRFIQRRHYRGTVHNMTVADDNSYCVGGHVVHNCMCYYEEKLMPPKDFANQVRGWVSGDNNFLDDYADWLGQRALAPIPDQITLMGIMELWLSNNVDAMATVLKG